MMDTNSPEFASLLAAATWWRDYAMRLRSGQDGYPESPYPALYPYTPYPPPGVTASPRDSQPEGDA